MNEFSRECLIYELTTMEDSLHKAIAEIKQAKHLTTDYISEKLELYNQDESDFYTDLNDIRKRVEGLNDWSERKR